MLYLVGGLACCKSAVELVKLFVGVRSRSSWCRRHFMRARLLSACLPHHLILHMHPCAPAYLFAPQASRLSHREDVAPGEKAPVSLFGNKSTEAAAAAAGTDFKKSSDKANTTDASEGAAAAAAAAKRKGEAAAEAAAEAKKTKTSRAPAPSLTPNKKFRDEEKNRTAHPVPFWNRTNWISGRKDGTGSRGGGNDAVAAKRTPALKLVDNVSTVADGSDSGKSSSKRAVGQVSGAGRTEEKGSSTTAGGSAGTGSAVEAAENFKRARQEERGATTGVAEGMATVPIRYQFRAGYTNAVRRPVRMRDLL